MIIGIGIDVINLERFHRSVARYGERIINRLFTEVEQEYCRRFISPREHFAVRFAAKEAFFKALGTGKKQNFRWRDIEIINEPPGRPKLLATGEAAKICAALGGKRLQVSLSHSHPIAAAVVIIED